MKCLFDQETFDLTIQEDGFNPSMFLTDAMREFYREGRRTDHVRIELYAKLLLAQSRAAAKNHETLIARLAALPEDGRIAVFEKAQSEYRLLALEQHQEIARELGIEK